MNKEEVIRILKTEKQYVCKAPGTYHLVYPPMIGFMRLNRYFKEFYRYEICIFKKGHIMQNESWNQAFKNNKQLYDYLEKTTKIIKNWAKDKKRFLDYCKKLPGAKKLSDKKLVSDYNKFMDKFVDVWTAPLITDGIGVYTESELYDDFLKEINNKGARKIFIELTHSPGLSFIGKEKMDLLKLAISYKKKDKEFQKKIRKHQKDYFWIENNYLHIKELPEPYFLGKVRADKRSIRNIQKEIKRLSSKEVIKKQQKIFDNIKISGKLKKKLMLTQLLSTWQDERKEICLRGNHYLNLFLKEIGKRMGFTIQQMYFVQPREINEFFCNGKRLSKKRVNKRLKICVHVAVYPFQDLFFEGKDALDILKAYESIKTEKEIKGVVASYSKENIIKGEANVVLDPGKARFRKGQILVTSMTRPEFVPIMHLAKAIITDEGGVTTHAGIVSRELGIGCIVGTRDATRLLKTGDKIVIDLEKGTVKKQ